MGNHGARRCFSRDLHSDNIMKWKIWYADGSTFDSSQGAPADAPTEGVQAIGECRDGRKLVHTGADFYRWNGRWQGTTSPIANLYDGTQNEIPAKKGSLIGTDLFKSIRGEATEWVQDHC